MTDPIVETTSVVVRPVARDDLHALAALAASVPPHDLLFLGRDIRQSKVLEAWLTAEAAGHTHSLVAVSGGVVVATIAAFSDRWSWSPHVCDIRLLVAPEWRNRGVGRKLLERAITDAETRGATKLTARMTPDQTGAITLFEESGFRAEALLRDYCRDAHGALHDLALLSLDPASRAGLRRAFES